MQLFYCKTNGEIHLEQVELEVHISQPVLHGTHYYLELMKLFFGQKHLLSTASWKPFLHV